MGRLLEHFSASYRCVAPNLRGYERSSAPADVEAYRAKHLVSDISSLIDSLGGELAALVAHDWGGGLAWGLAAQRPEAIGHLVIINSPHPATFLRELRSNPAQQTASAYMNFLCRPDAEALLSENDFARLWPFFTSMGAADPAREGGGWLTDDMRERYRAVWRTSLRGGCNYYRASPLRPPLAPRRSGHDDRARALGGDVARADARDLGRGRHRPAGGAARRAGGVRSDLRSSASPAPRTGSSTSGRRSSPPRSSARSPS